MEPERGIVEFEPGYAGQSKILELALVEVLSQDRFSAMTMAEMVGTLELVKVAILQELE